MLSNQQLESSNNSLLTHISTVTVTSTGSAHRLAARASHMLTAWCGLWLGCCKTAHRPDQATKTATLVIPQRKDDPVPCHFNYNPVPCHFHTNPVPCQIHYNPAPCQFDYNPVPCTMSLSLQSCTLYPVNFITTLYPVPCQFCYNPVPCTRHSH
jgi:hypothetical protein